MQGKFIGDPLSVLMELDLKRPVPSFTMLGVAGYEGQPTPNEWTYPGNYTGMHGSNDVMHTLAPEVFLFHHFCLALPCRRRRDGRGGSLCTRASHGARHVLPAPDPRGHWFACAH
jgi:hypothetical protein